MRFGLCRDGPQLCPMPVVPWASEMTGHPVSGGIPRGTKNARKPAHPAVHTGHRRIDGSPRLPENGVTVKRRDSCMAPGARRGPGSPKHLRRRRGAALTMGAASGHGRQLGFTGRQRQHGQKEQSCERQPPTPTPDEPSQCCPHVTTYNTTPRMIHIVRRRRTDCYVAEDSRNAVTWYGQSAARGPGQRHQRGRPFPWWWTSERPSPSERHHMYLAMRIVHLCRRRFRTSSYVLDALSVVPPLGAGVDCGTRSGA